MICTSLKNRNLEELFDALETPGMEMAEIRLDSCDLSMEDIDVLFSDADVPLIACCRVSELCPAAKAEALLLRAIKAGANYVDLEMNAPAMMSKRIRREISNYGTTLIRSYHNFEATDSTIALESIILRCLSLGADYVKIVCKANSEEDNKTILSLYEGLKEKNLIAFCMGEIGKSTRLDALALGAAFSYACLNEKEKTAEGQFSLQEMSQLVYDKFRMPGYSNISGECPLIEIPSSKSQAQRAIIAAALAPGLSIIENFSPCEDSMAALKIAKDLGAEYKIQKDRLEIRGNFQGFPEKINCGESALLSRLMLMIVGLNSDKEHVLDGCKSLKNRSIANPQELFELIGLRLSSDKLPIKFKMEKRQETYFLDFDNPESSQIISALFFAFALMSKEAFIHINKPKSLPYIFMTIDLLQKFGIEISNEMEGSAEFVETGDLNLCEAVNFKISGNQSFKAANIVLESDWSTAANFMVAAAIFGRLDIANLNFNSLQADIAIFDRLLDIGVNISQDLETGFVHIQRAPLRSFNFDIRNSPDLFPILAVLAAFCNGCSCIESLSALRNKESDRLAAVEDFLQKMGVKYHLQKDKIIIYGMSLAQRLLQNKLLEGGEYSAFADHRIYMAIKIASIAMNKALIMEDEECLNKSCPKFLDIFKQIY